MGKTAIVAAPRATPQDHDQNLGGGDPRKRELIDAAVRARALCGAKARPVPELLEGFRTLMELGMPMKHAANALKIGETTLHEWIKTRGDWADAAETGRAAFVAEHLQGITEAAKKTWQARAWLLERCQPEYFSRAREIAMGSAMGGALSTTILAQMASQEPVDAGVITEAQKVISTNRNDQLPNAEPRQQVIDISDNKDDHEPARTEATTPPSPQPLTVSPLPKKISPKKAPRQRRSTKGRTANVPASPSNESDPFA